MNTSTSSHPSPDNTTRPGPILVLGATGKTGSRVIRRLQARGLPVRGAARRGADVFFDWDDPTTFSPALAGIGGVYLIPPVLRTDFAPVVGRFLDVAEATGVGHVTLLSAWGMETAPAEVALRAVELDLTARPGLCHSILRPAWFMENFSENFLRPVADVITVPCGSGSEAFVSVEDIAAVAAACLADPATHGGQAYAPSGPEALSFAEAAAHIAEATGRPIRYQNTDREQWIAAMVAAGVPGDYGAVLRTLTAIVAAGGGARPNDHVARVTGQVPTTFSSFAIRTAAASLWR